MPWWKVWKKWRKWKKKRNKWRIKKQKVKRKQLKNLRKPRSTETLLLHAAAASAFAVTPTPKTLPASDVSQLSAELSPLVYSPSHSQSFFAPTTSSSSWTCTFTGTSQLSCLFYSFHLWLQCSSLLSSSPRILSHPEENLCQPANLPSSQLPFAASGQFATSSGSTRETLSTPDMETQKCSSDITRSQRRFTSSPFWPSLSSSSPSTPTSFASARDMLMIWERMSQRRKKKWWRKTKKWWSEKVFEDYTSSRIVLIQLIVVIHYFI